MTVPSGRRRREDHAGYIKAVRHELETNDIHVPNVQVSIAAGGRREASLNLRADREAFAEHLPDSAMAYWDENNGWSASARRDGMISRVHKGLGALPTPQDVTAWLIVLLTHPELAPSYEDHPFRNHTTSDPDFERQLLYRGQVDLPDSRP